jgi:hypothetical protein
VRSKFVGIENSVDQDGVHVLQDRRAAARDPDVAVASGLAGLVEGVLDAVVDEVERGAAGQSISADPPGLRSRT